MIVGSIGYATNSGLGHLVRDFYRHGIINRVLYIKHSHYQSYPEWYAPEHTYTRETSESFLSGLDVLLLFETAFHWQVVANAKKRGIRVVLTVNYEYTPHPIPVPPDLVLCGSLLDVDYYKQYPHCFLPIPVEQEWKLRTRAEAFIHNAGHGQWNYVKGTPQLIEAMQYVQSPVKLKIRGQPGEKRIKELFAQHQYNPKIELEFGEMEESQLYATGDVFINAEQLNGMSLPLNEARAAGLLVMTTNRYPANTWLPNEPLIPVERYVRDRVGAGYLEFDRAIIDPKAIAAKIDEYYGKDITDYSLSGKSWAEQNSWDVLKPLYLSALAPTSKL